MNTIISNQEFSDRVSAVAAARDKWIGLIESRLKDLTGLRLSKEKNYQYPFEGNEDETPIKRNGKASIVIFPTNLIERDFRTDNQYDVWNFILGRIDPHKVFKVPQASEHREIDDDAASQLEIIRNEVLQSYDGSYYSEFEETDSRIFDVLGVFDPYQHMIKLYAQVIAWYSLNKGIDTEYLAFIVLTHELAHAYTMAGYDIDGNRGNLLNPACQWNTYVIEGLAQYYTEAVCYQLNKNPQFKAFEILLDKQLGPYTWHKHWFDGSKAHEVVRALIMNYRHKPDYADFKGSLGLSDSILNSIP